MKMNFTKKNDSVVETVVMREEHDRIMAVLFGARDHMTGLLFVEVITGDTVMINLDFVADISVIYDR